MALLSGGSECALIAPLFANALGAGGDHAAQGVLAGRVELQDLLLHVFQDGATRPSPQARDMLI